ncbi:hypothetical protein [Pontiella agarivorans]|uniref:Outer membrane porin, OprD family n=1 Tax=Pontiella agarivorans TaxID=3038953 RepID=A0ABU5N1S0_9BACT|nr:hypothetical protein [Pontiella agarivorans]MDZ8120400.1 hypothetical protein [Pontiella agarivorans]
MKQKTTCILAATLAASFATAESVVKPLNEKGFGTLSGRLQSVSMYRDYDNGANAYSTTLGFLLKYTSPDLSGWSLGAAYNGAGVLDSMDYGKTANPGDYLVSNGRIHVLNEAYVNYTFLEYSSASVGRQINNAEVFRADDIRQKSRSITALQARFNDIGHWRFAGGHAIEQSGILDAGDRWKFRNYGEIFGKSYDTDGMTWGEAAYTGMEELDIALFDAAAWDVANLFGIRAGYTLSEKTSLLGYYRNEFNLGRAATHHADALGLSVVQRVGKVRVEGGYFGVYGDGLQFNPFTTGFNHALGTSLMFYTDTFAGGADSFYLKATTRLERSETILYTLLQYTKQNDLAALNSAGELDLIVKQPVGENMTVCGKAGLGYQDGPNTPAGDFRLFLTYAF